MKPMRPGKIPASARRLIRRLRLKPHPEGGFYRETYRAAGGRYSSAILFLLPQGSVSRLHRIKSDEVWHFHLGGPLVVVELDLASGRTRRTKLGPKHRLQHVVKAGTWFGAWLELGADYALVGCTVAPAFEFKDLELGRRGELLKCFPKSNRVLRRLLP